MLLDDETMNILMSVFFEFKEGSYDADGSDGDGKETDDDGCKDAVYGRQGDRPLEFARNQDHQSDLAESS